MKAVIWTAYGPPEVLQLQEIENPSPGKDQVLVRVEAAGVTAGDCEMRRLELPLGLGLLIRLYAGLPRPKRIPILGQELAGTIAVVGEKVEGFEPGDPVFGTTGFSFGAYAEYLCLPAEPGDAEGVLARRPANLTAAEAAIVPTAGLEALHYLREGGAGPGTKVLVVGGGGSIGTYAIQLAKSFGADVTGIDHGAKHDLMRSLGADRVIDHTREDPTVSGEKYDLVIDVVGKKGLVRRLRLLKPGGEYFLAFARPADLLLRLWGRLTGRGKLRIESASQEKADLEYLSSLIEEGKLKPVLDRVFPLEGAALAHHYAESGEKKGNVALRVE